MTKKNAAIIFAIMISLVFVEVVYFNNIINEKERDQAFLVGKKIEVLSDKHVEQGTKIQYNSNPPTSGTHYPVPQKAGVYTKAPPDGNLVHSMEHGAIIVWYNPSKLSEEDTKILTNIFTLIDVEKKILTSRDNLPTAIALTSWGRLMSLESVDQKQITNFFKMNYDKGPEKEPI